MRTLNFFEVFLFVFGVFFDIILVYGRKRFCLMKEEKKPKSKFRSFLDLLFIILLVAGGWFGLNYFYSHDTHATVSSSISFSNDARIVTLDSVDFVVPSNIFVGNNGDFFTLDDSEHKFVIRIDVRKSEIDNFKNNLSRVKADKYALYNGEASVKTHNDKEYIVMEMGKWFSKTLRAFTAVSDDKMLVISVINKKNTYDYKLLEKFFEGIEWYENEND